MMAHLIEEIAGRLQEVNSILASKHDAKEVSFYDASVLACFYHDYKNTNSVIDAAEYLAHHDKDALLAQATNLAQRLREFSALDLTMWQRVDFAAIEQAYDPVHERRWKDAKDKATELWKKYQADSNRLDMMPLDSQEYEQLDAQCEANKQAYETARKQANELYDLYKQEQELRAHVHYFEMQFLELWVAKMSQIAEAIIRDTRCLIEEGQA